MVTNINMESYWNPNAWECYMEGQMLGFSRMFLKSATCQSHMNRKKFHIETWKKVSNLYNIDNYDSHIYIYTRF